MSEQKEQNAKQNEQENSSQKQDGLNFSEQDFEDFVRRFSDYLANANESKKRGNNDYNPLKAVQSPHDEVNMHSGFLASLLNTRGEHYQDDLFLRLFLQALGLAEWFGSTKNAQVFKETQKIDIHIFNSEKHIIIENKIRADDQDEQIARYIHSVKSENVEYENIAVVYLSPFGREPSQDSLSLKDENIEWKIKGNSLEFNENKIEYRQISYKKDILAWIESCQKEVGNITNLNSALEFYKDIVEIITNQKESKMSIAGFFGENADGIKEFLPQEKRFKIAFEILVNRNEIIGAYLKQIADNLSKQLISKNCNIEYHDSDIPFISIKTQEYSLEKNIIQFYFYISNFGAEHRTMYCSILTEKVNSMSKKFKEIQEIIKNSFSEVNLCQDNIKAGSNKDRICLKEPNEFAIRFEKINDFEKEVLNFINERIDLVNQLNKKLKDLKG